MKLQPRASVKFTALFKQSENSERSYNTHLAVKLMTTERTALASDLNASTLMKPAPST